MGRKSNSGSNRIFFKIYVEKQSYMITLVLKENSPEIREKLKSSGIDLCTCCEFKDAVWLDYNHSVTPLVHGIGYSDETSGNLDVEKVLECYVKECKRPYYCKDVDEFINRISLQRILSKERYIVVTWTDDIQSLMDKEGFKENSYLINDEKGLDDFGSSAYFVNEEWYESIKKQR